jgi:flagellar biosynthesis protein
MKKNRPKAARREQAVALGYHSEAERAPTVLAKGRGLIAEKIKEVAREHGIPIHRDDDLVELLAQVDIDREIPPELYAAVAEVLSWIYRANSEMRKEIST